MVPKVTVEIGDEPTAKKVVRLVEGLEDNDDVQDVYANFDIPESRAGGRRVVGEAAMESVSRFTYELLLHASRDPEPGTCGSP